MKSNECIHFFADLANVTEHQPRLRDGCGGGCGDLLTTLVAPTLQPGVWALQQSPFQAHTHLLREVSEVPGGGDVATVSCAAREKACRKDGTHLTTAGWGWCSLRTGGARRIEGDCESPSRWAEGLWWGPHTQTTTFWRRWGESHGWGREAGVQGCDFHRSSECWA